jgi:Uma2 family endonuclease
MTVMAERTTHMLVEDFEELASTAPDTVTLEFINGRIGEKYVPDGNHGEIIKWLQQRCMQHRTDLWLYADERGLKVEAYRKGRARPDGVLAADGHFTGRGEWSDPEGVLMVVEVTSYDRDTDLRDRTEKPAAYAAAGIPLYLLVDRDACAVVVHSNPYAAGGTYRHIDHIPFGEQVELPDPVGFTLDTEVLKNYVR